MSAYFGALALDRGEGSGGVGIDRQEGRQNGSQSKMKEASASVPD